MLPTAGLIDQVAVKLVGPETAAVNCCVLPALRLMVVGLMLIDVGVVDVVCDPATIVI